jgi:hypothetical protein
MYYAKEAGSNFVLGLDELFNNGSTDKFGRYMDLITENITSARNIRKLRTVYLKNINKICDVVGYFL